mgnify:CR=1 FL=1
MSKLQEKVKLPSYTLGEELLNAINSYYGYQNMEDILNGLAKKTSETNTITSLKQALSRFRKNQSKNYYYDEIKVFCNSW